MIERWWSLILVALGFGVLAGSFAYALQGSSLSDDVPISITGGGGGCTTVNCGSVTAPSQASAVGYMTTVINIDFRSTWWATKSNWLDCNIPNTVDSGHNFFLHNGFDATPTNVAKCNEAVSQANDPAAGTGQNVLRGRWLSSYTPNVCGPGFESQAVSLETFNAAEATPRNIWWGYPLNSYIEYEARITNTNSGGCNDIQSIFSTSFDRTQVAPTGDEWLEPDVGELTTSANGAANGAWHHWCNVSCTGEGSDVRWSTSGAPDESADLPPGYSFFDYHRYGLRITSSGNTVTYCFYIDDILQIQCDTNTTIQTVRARPLFLLFAIVNSNAGTTYDFNIKSIRIWSCANHMDIYNSPSTPVCS